MLAGYDHLLAAARRLQWDAEAIDLSADAIPASGRAGLVELVAGFWIAERAVAAELSPFVAAAPPDSAARACFAAQAGDEARHARFFDRVAREVLELDEAAIRAAARPELTALFEVSLPETARALAAGATGLGDAVGLYHLILEGIVFSLGQDALLALLHETDSMPGVAQGAARVQADERWHVGLGVLALQRLGARIDVSAAAARAVRSWGPAVATPDRVARVLATHGRRLRIAGGEAATLSGVAATEEE